MLVIALSIAGAISATAQPYPHGAFVDLRVGPDVDDMREFRMSGTTRRVGVALGVDWGRSGIELDVAVPEWHTEISGSTSVFVGPSGLHQTHGHVYESSETVRRRSTDVSLLYRLNVPFHPRFTCTLLLGAAKVYRPQHESSTLNEVLPDSTRQNVYAVSRTTSRDYVGGVTRLDADVRIAGHVWLGPRFTLTMYPTLLDESALAPRGFVGRAELAVRWRF
jgi:hypothetical protein